MNNKRFSKRMLSWELVSSNFDQTYHPQYIIQNSLTRILFDYKSLTVGILNEMFLRH